LILRPYQEKSIADIRAGYASGSKSICLTAPCGAGKTVMFSKISELASAKGTRIAILVHRDSLLTQASDKLSQCGVEHGIIAPGYASRGEKVQVASVQTLVRRLDQHEFDLLVVDECHHAISPTYTKIFERYPLARVLGVTATPCRTNGAGLNSVFQKLVLGPNISQLIEDGYLVEPITYGPTHVLNLSKIGTVAGDYDLQALAAHMDDPRITGDAVEAYTKLCPGKPAMVFACNVKHAEDIAAAFSAAGYRAESVDGKMDLRLIRDRIAGLRDGSVQVLASCALVSEGTDIPDVVTAIMLRPTRSLSLSIQQGGRALRPVYAPGHDLSTRAGRLAAIAAGPKPKALILDHAGNVFRFMTVDEPHEWTLEGRKKRKRGEITVINIRQCPKCAHTHRTAPKCPKCGWVYEVMAKDPEIEDGELAPIDKVALRRAKAKEVAQARTLEQLQAIGQKRGYHPFWANHIMREREAKRAAGNALAQGQDMFR
jgi:superfamily II DNA or RNA helicase